MSATDHGSIFRPFAHKKFFGFHCRATPLPPVFRASVHQTQSSLKPRICRPCSGGHPRDRQTAFRAPGPLLPSSKPPWKASHAPGRPAKHFHPSNRRAAPNVFEADSMRPELRAKPGPRSEQTKRIDESPRGCSSVNSQRKTSKKNNGAACRSLRERVDSLGDDSTRIKPVGTRRPVFVPRVAARRNLVVNVIVYERVSGIEALHMAVHHQVVVLAVVDAERHLVVVTQVAVARPDIVINPAAAAEPMLVGEGIIPPVGGPSAEKHLTLAWLSVKLRRGNMGVFREVIAPLTFARIKKLSPGTDSITRGRAGLFRVTDVTADGPHDAILDHLTANMARRIVRIVGSDCVVRIRKSAVRRIRVLQSHEIRAPGIRDLQALGKCWRAFIVEPVQLHIGRDPHS